VRWERLSVGKSHKAAGTGVDALRPAASAAAAISAAPLTLTEGSSATAALPESRPALPSSPRTVGKAAAIMQGGWRTRRAARHTTRAASAAAASAQAFAAEDSSSVRIPPRPTPADTKACQSPVRLPVLWGIIAGRAGLHWCEECWSFGLERGLAEGERSKFGPAHSGTIRFSSKGWAKSHGITPTAARGCSSAAMTKCVAPPCSASEEASCARESAMKASNSASSRRANVDGLGGGGT